jgi:hypothetical protein
MKRIATNAVSVLLVVSLVFAVSTSAMAIRDLPKSPLSGGKWFCHMSPA